MLRTLCKNNNLKVCPKYAWPRPLPAIRKATPKNKSATTNFKGAVRKIVIDDFDESTQLAILLNKPILGYDIINSKGTPGTIVFIHTEMKKSEVAYLKEHINKEGTSVFNRAKTSGFPKYNTNFKYAFD